MTGIITMLTLQGLNNPFEIMAYTTNAMRKAGVSPVERNQYTKNVAGGSYENLVSESQKVLDVLNSHC